MQLFENVPISIEDELQNVGITEKEAKEKSRSVIQPNMKEIEKTEDKQLNCMEQCVLFVDSILKKCMVKEEKVLLKYTI